MARKPNIQGYEVFHHLCKLTDMDVKTSVRIVLENLCDIFMIVNKSGEW